MPYNRKIDAALQIGSVFEYVNDKPVFGVLYSDSIFYAPVLGFFAFTGIPTSVSHSISLLSKKKKSHSISLGHFFLVSRLYFFIFILEFLSIEFINLSI